MKDDELHKSVIKIWADERNLPAIVRLYSRNHEMVLAILENREDNNYLSEREEIIYIYIYIYILIICYVRQCMLIIYSVCLCFFAMLTSQPRRPETLIMVGGDRRVNESGISFFSQAPAPH